MTVPEDPVGDLPPVDELDELASARLDGVDPADAVDPAVEAEVARRQARFERVRAVLAEPVAVDPDARDAAIAAALDAATSSAGTDDLAARRSARGARRAAGLKVLGAAAAVVAAIALGAAVLSQGDGDDVDASGDAPTDAEASLGGDGSTRCAADRVGPRRRRRRAVRRRRRAPPGRPRRVHRRRGAARRGRRQHQ